jgi:nitroreductase
MSIGLLDATRTGEYAMNEALFEAIFHRKSVRSFVDNPNDDEHFAQILDFANNVASLYPDLKIAFAIEHEFPIGLFAVKAPNYLCLYTDKSDNFEYLVNAGYVLQHVDLYLHTLGFGSCWLGVAKPKIRVIGEKNYLIMLAFGRPRDLLGRSSPQDFKRKTLAQISSGDDLRLEAARLAPSATNSQNWFFAATEKHISVYTAKLSGAKKRLYQNLTYIDAGIALCHLKLASEHFSLSFDYHALSIEDAPHKEDYKYLASV